MFPERPEPNYIAWVAVIAIGVTVGNLLSNWITAEVVAYQAKQAIAQASNALAAQAAHSRRAADAQAAQTAAAAADTQERARQQRANDRMGIRLRQTCSEWQRADQQLKSFTTGQEVAKHCGRYERYVQAGVIPAGE